MKPTKPKACETYIPPRQPFTLRLWRELKNRLICMYYKRKLYAFGSGHIHKSVKIFQPSAISIGYGILLNEGVKIEAVGKTECPILTIGDNCVVSCGTRIQAALSLIINNDVQIAQRCLITDHEHVWTAPGKVIHDKLDALPVNIGKGVFIGEQSIVLRGVSIGEGSIIGAGSIVKCDIPANCIAVGTPAKVIKEWCFESQSWRKVNY